MMSSPVDQTISRYLIFGIPLTSAFLWTSGTTDPVNVTKLFVLGGVAGAVGVVAFSSLGRYIWRYFKVQTLALFLFLAAMVNSLIFGQAPFLQSWYGAYGRQTGFITYAFLSIVLIATMAVRDSELRFKLIKGIIAVGIINIIYCAWVLVFGDFLPWNNVYRSILGLFGNPDFISAFLGIFIVVCIAIILDPKSHSSARISLLIASALAFLEIVKSHAIQGIVVTFGGLVLVGFFWIRSIFDKWIIPILYGVSALFLGLVAVLGTLQVGPLSFIYKRSVSLRGSYWRAGLGMGEKFPFSGVGLDGYGDFYRQLRPPVALVDTPGVQIVSNVSHNVFIDFFASGGWPLLIAYLFLNSLVLITIIRCMLKFKKYDFIFVAISTAWICYTVQSIISINQIGLAIWGWVLSGLILGYSVELRSIEAGTTVNKVDSRPKTSQKSVKASIFSPQLVAGIGCIVGLFISFPPLGSDIKWKSGLDSRNLTQVEKALSNSFLNPVPSSRYSMAYQVFGNSNLPDKALEYTRKITKMNPNYFEGWRALYLLPSSTHREKELAARNLKRLDPLNPDVLSKTP